MKKLLKKLKAFIMNYDIDALIAVKDSFQGNSFQWVKTNDRSKLGKVVRVTDVEPGRNGYLAKLSDGSVIPTDRLTSDLLMLMDDQPALSMEEVMSINYVPGLEGEIKVADAIPAEFKEQLAAAPAPEKLQAAQVQPRAVNSDPGDLFGMFSLEETDLTLSV